MDQPTDSRLSRAILRLAGALLPPVRRLMVAYDALRKESQAQPGDRNDRLQREQLFASLFEQTQDAVVIFDLNGVCIEVNQRAAEISGFGRDALLGLVFGDVSVDKAAAKALFQRVLGGEQIPLYERTLRRADGSPLYAETSITLVRDDHGEPQYVQVIDRDVSERYRKQIEQANEHRLLQTMIENIPDPVYVKDTDGRYLVVNAAYTRLLGRPETEIIGQTDVTLALPGVTANLSADEQAIIAGDEPNINREQPVERSDGQPAWELVTRAPMRDAHGQITGVIGLTRDITERIQREQQREENERFIHKVASTIPDVLFVYDFEQQAYRYYNEGAIAKALGYDSAEFNRQDQSFMASIMHPDDLPTFAQWYERFVKLGDDDTLETHYRLRHKNGEWRHFYSRDRVFARNAEGIPTQSLGIAQDITGSLLAERQLRRQNEYLRALSEVTPAVVNRFDPDAILNTLLDRVKALMQTEYVYMDVVVGTDAARPGHLKIERFRGDAYSIAPGKGIVGQAYQTGEVVVVEDYRNWLHRVDAPQLSHVRATIGVPVRSGGQVSAILGVSYTNAERTFETAEIEILTRFAELATITLENARLFTAAQTELAERKRAEAALRASENRYRAVVESQTELITRFSPDNLVTFVNEAYCRYFNTTPEEILGRTIQRRIPDDDWAKIEPVLFAQLRGEIEVEHYEHRVVMPDGEIRWQQWTDRVIYDEQGQIVELQAVGRDITEQKQAEIALNSERDFVAAILDNTISLLTVEDRDGRIVTFNRACEALSRYSIDEIAGKFLWDTLLPPEEVAQVQAVFSRINAGDFPNKNINHWVTKDGRRVLIEWSNTALTDEHGQVTHIVSSGIDVTARKQLEERSLELALEREKVKILGNFIRDASHDFRTPLSILNTNLYLIRRMEGAAPLEPRLTEMEQQVVHLTRLIDQLLTMTRLDSGSEAHFAPVDLNDVIQNVMASLHKTFHAKQLNVDLRLADALPALHGEAWQLNQALRNVLLNAAQFTPVGGSVRVETAQESEHITVRVTDTGSGIEPGDLPHIFERFYRADKARSGSDAGTGLGLAITRKIVDLHEGTIEVDSHPGAGTTFSIILPIRTQSENTTQPLTSA